MQGWVFNVGLLAASFLAMEALAWIIHRYVMHGPGWAWHRSHHEEGVGRWGPFELNDLYAIVLGAITVGLIWLGSRDGRSPLYFVGAGASLFGLAYFLLHDVLVHQRLPLKWTPRRGYLKRLVQAHRLHHATHGRDGAVSYGFLYAPPVRRLKARLQEQQKRLASRP
jgi:beta-carotene 3-hydroxylase